MKKDAVIGIGNPAIGDEGIGNAVVTLLPTLFDCTDVDCLDLGTGVFSLMHVLPGRRRAVIVDCAFMGEEPGTMRGFTLRNARSVKKLAHLSLHEGDVIHVLRLAETHGDGRSPRVVIYGIEPAALDIGLSLSEELEQKIPDYCRKIARDLGLNSLNG
ncbi:MAG TPA: hydrogenase maturation protease [Spirochaetia bacterium]|nr:hydrogenase maturation protease [Spirochaetia bacterium]